MATTFRKAMLRVGTHHSPDGTIDVTPERLAHWSDEFGRMSNNGLAIPMHWDHSTDQKMLEPIGMDSYERGRSRSAKNSVGRMTAFEVAEDGESAVVTFETADDAATEKVEANTVYVSPVIMPKFKDGQGEEYSDTITHLDLVNYPVDHNQSDAEKVEDGAVALALRMGIETTVYRMAEDTETPVSTVTVGEVLPLLAEAGLPLPEDTNGQNFLDRLNVALRVAIESDKEPGMENENQPSEDTTVVDPTPEMMSLQRESKATAAYAEKMHRDAIKAKLDQCLSDGRCTKEQHAKRDAQIGTIRLSLDAEGNPERSTVEDFIDDCQSVQVGTFWDEDTKAKRMSVVEPDKVVRFGTGADDDDWYQSDEGKAALARMTR